MKQKLINFDRAVLVLWHGEPIWVSAAVGAVISETEDKLSLRLTKIWYDREIYPNGVVSVEGGGDEPFLDVSTASIRAEQTL